MRECSFNTWSIDFYTTRGVAPWWSGERMQRYCSEATPGHLLPVKWIWQLTRALPSEHMNDSGEHHLHWELFFTWQPEGSLQETNYPPLGGGGGLAQGGKGDNKSWSFTHLSLRIKEEDEGVLPFLFLTETWPEVMWEVRESPFVS